MIFIRHSNKSFCGGKGNAFVLNFGLRLSMLDGKFNSRISGYAVSETKEGRYYSTCGILSIGATKLHSNIKRKY